MGDGERVCIAVDEFYIAQLDGGGFVTGSIGVFKSTVREVMQETYGISPDRYKIVRVKGTLGDKK